MHSHRFDHESASLRSVSSTYSHPHDHHDQDNHLQHHHDAAAAARNSTHGFLPPPYPRSRQSSLVSERSCSDMTDAETRALWRCMLDLQREYGCYKSARIDLALSAGDENGDLMPTRFIIDILNDSIVDLPDEGWSTLYQHLAYPSLVH